MSTEVPRSHDVSNTIRAALEKLRAHGAKDVGNSHGEHDAIRRMFEFAIQSRETAVFAGRTASATAGSYTETGGLRKYRLRDEYGVDEEFELPSRRKGSDIQTVAPITKHPPSCVQDDRRCTARATDDSLSIDDRVEALREWIADQPGSAADFIASQLQLDDLSPEWLRIVIYGAEDVRFRSSETRVQVAQSLVMHALRLRESPSADDGPAVMSAIRRAGSLGLERHLEKFLELLNGGTPIDSRLVALQALCRRFWTTPPNESASSRRIAERAATLARKHWDKDVFRAGEISAIAGEATLVATQLGAHDAERCVELAKSTNRRYVVRKLATRLAEIRDHWLKIPASEAVARIDAVLARLR